MYREDGQLVAVDDVRDAIEQADVLIVGFRDFTERMLVDRRTNETDGPLVRVVEPVGGVAERMHWLGQHRPRFGLPQRFTFFVWPHSLGYLEATGVVRALRESVASGTGSEQLSAALGELHAVERAARRSAIHGTHPWRTLWSREGSART